MCSPDGISPEFYVIQHPAFVNYTVLFSNTIIIIQLLYTQKNGPKSMVFILQKKGNIYYVDSKGVLICLTFWITKSQKSMKIS